MVSQRGQDASSSAVSKDAVHRPPCSTGRNAHPLRCVDNDLIDHTEQVQGAQAAGLIAALTDVRHLRRSQYRKPLDRCYAVGFPTMTHHAPRYGTPGCTADALRRTESSSDKSMHAANAWNHALEIVHSRRSSPRGVRNHVSRPCSRPMFMIVIWHVAHRPATRRGNMVAHASGEEHSSLASDSVWTRRGH